jgi:hypothetical protein
VFAVLGVAGLLYALPSASPVLSSGAALQYWLVWLLLFPSVALLPRISSHPEVAVALVLIGLGLVAYRVFGESLTPELGAFARPRELLQGSFLALAGAALLVRRKGTKARASAAVWLALGAMALGVVWFWLAAR